MIIVTKSASKALLQNLQEEGKTKDSHYLRVGVASGGCSGLQYFMEFFDKNETFDGDTVIENDIIDVVVDKLSVLYIAGSQLDYSSGLNGKGFEWSNPNANRTCGCGESFSL